MDDIGVEANDWTANPNDRNLALWLHGWMVGRETATIVYEEVTRELDPRSATEISRTGQEISRRIRQEMPDDKYNARFSQAIQAVLKKKQEDTVKDVVRFLNFEATVLDQRYFNVKQKINYTLNPAITTMLLETCEKLAAEASLMRVLARRVSYMTFSDLTKVPPEPGLAGFILPDEVRPTITE